MHNNITINILLLAKIQITSVLFLTRISAMCCCLCCCHLFASHIIRIVMPATHTHTCKFFSFIFSFILPYTSCCNS